ncbi:hypothetical protein, partial [Roseateles saccharophilus]
MKTRLGGFFIACRQRHVGSRGELGQKLRHRLQAGLEAVQALTLAMPAGSETARALVRFVREALSP